MHQITKCLSLVLLTSLAGAGCTMTGFYVESDIPGVASAIAEKSLNTIYLTCTGTTQVIEVEAKARLTEVWAVRQSYKGRKHCSTDYQ